MRHIFRYGVDNPEQMMRLLRLGLTDLVVADTLTIATLAGEAGLAPGQVRYQMPLVTQGTYIAFFLNTEAQVVARWQQALEAMREALDEALLGQCGSEESSEEGSEENPLLRLLTARPRLTGKEAAEQQRAVEKQLARLKASGRIRRIGPNKDGYWQVFE